MPSTSSIHDIPERPADKHPYEDGDKPLPPIPDRRDQSSINTGARPYNEIPERSPKDRRSFPLPPPVPDRRSRSMDVDINPYNEPYEESAPKPSPRPFDSTCESRYMCMSGGSKKVSKNDMCDDGYILSDPKKNYYSPVHS